MKWTEVPFARARRLAALLTDGAGGGDAAKSKATAGVANVRLASFEMVQAPGFPEEGAIDMGHFLTKLAADAAKWDAETAAAAGEETSIHTPSRA